MTTRYNAVNAKKMHELGIEFCLAHLKCKRHGQRIYMADGSEVQVHTQTTMGQAFTIHVSYRDGFVEQLKRSAHVFVNYNEVGKVSVHFLEKPTDDSYTMSLVGKEAIALVFNAEKCTELFSVTDREVWDQFRKYSASARFNLNAPSYSS